MAGFSVLAKGLRSRKGLAIGGGVGIVALLVSGFFALATFKLIHIRQVVGDHFDRRQQRSTQIRVGKNWQLVLDPDGQTKGYRKNTPGQPISNAIYNYKTDRLVADLKKRGFEAKFDGGKLSGFTKAGELISLKDATVGQRRSVLRQELSKAYPEMGFLRRNVRARKLYGHFGISLRFFADTREKIADKEVDIRNNFVKKIRERVFGSTNTDITYGKSGESSTDKAEQTKIDTDNSAASEFDSKLTDEATKLKAKALANPGEKLSIPVGKTAANALGGGIEGGVKGALLGPVNTVGNICAVKSLMSRITVTAKVLRAAPLAIYAGTILTAADSLKNGKVNAQEFNQLMKSLDGFEKSGAWQRITGSNKKATINSRDKFSLDGGATGAFAVVNDKIEGLAGANISSSGCRVITNPITQIGGAIVNIGAQVIAVPVSGGTSIVATAAAGAAIGVVRSIAFGILEPIAIRQIAGMTITGDETPEENGDAVVAGYDVIANANARGNGGRILTPAEVAGINRAIALEDRQEAKLQSLAYRLFNLNNPKSLLARIAFSVPTSLGELGTKVNTFLAATNPFNTRLQFAYASSLATGFSPTALADSDGDDPFGVDQYGFTDDELEKFDPIENEEFIYQNESTKTAYKEYINKCLDPVESTPVTLADKPCTDNNNETNLRFRLHYFDQGLVENYIVNNSTEESDATTSDIAVPSDVRELAQALLDKEASGQVTFTDGGGAKKGLELVAAGKRIPLDDSRCKYNGVRADKTSSLDKNLLTALLKVTATHKIGIGYLTNGCHDGVERPSRHYVGKGVDFNTIDGKESDGNTPADWQFATDLAKYLPAGSRFGQEQCGLNATNVKGDDLGFFTDPCTHVHVDVP